MQIVINFSDDSYNDIVNGTLPARCITEMLDAIRNGKPLPKSHGRLIDADTLDECKEIMHTIMRESKYAVRMDEIRNIPTIIEAAKEREGK